MYEEAVNLSGAILFRTVGVWFNASLLQILGLLNYADMSRTPVESFAEMFSAAFVPILLTISLLVFFFIQQRRKV